MILKLLKPLSFIPALLLMYIIYSFSAQDGDTSSQLSYKVSYEIVEVGSEVLDVELQTWEKESLATRFHGAVRKLAHMTEYFALAVAMAFPLYVYGLRGILLMLVAGGLCVAFACGDEYHQSFVSGRSPSKRDVLIDSFGIFWGIILVRIIGWTGRHTIFRPFRKKKKAAATADYGYAPYFSGESEQAPFPSGRSYPPPFPEPEYEEEIPDSDRLSEDMSFRKLMQDLKEQKRESGKKRK